MNFTQKICTDFLRQFFFTQKKFQAGLSQNFCVHLSQVTYQNAHNALSYKNLLCVFSLAIFYQLFTLTRQSTLLFSYQFFFSPSLTSSEIDRSRITFAKKNFLVLLFAIVLEFQKRYDHQQLIHHNILLLLLQSWRMCRFFLLIIIGPDMY